jgi:hypothetical protein
MRSICFIQKFIMIMKAPSIKKTKKIINLSFLCNYTKKIKNNKFKKYI